MACINMLKDHPSLCGAPPPMSPRISFSNDFAVEPPPPRKVVVPPNQDFEFAVGGRPMIAADELFFKGRMLPLLDCHSQPSLSRTNTLREELLVSADQPNDWVRPRAIRWKEFLGLRRTQCRSPAARKNDKVDSFLSVAGAALEPPVGNAGKFSQAVKGDDHGGFRDADHEDSEIKLQC
ncbi:hypothetical protein AXF42_Ash020574 [Apostasia shenzhenica]|uniref:Uncharacterized protein n=1 Tax=Apostasia shenzhenica TaxID=1088818 RepID=A0A2I0B605_9ASPA|nr:hypothetical protein AXF42_Ash020574 [Apostasia shenzhenica]